MASSENKVNGYAMDSYNTHRQRYVESATPENLEKVIKTIESVWHKEFLGSTKYKDRPEKIDLKKRKKEIIDYHKIDGFPSVHYPTEIDDYSPQYVMGIDGETKNIGTETYKSCFSVEPDK